MRNRGFEICSTYLNKNITLPKRATNNSAGYDFESSEDIIIPSIWNSFLEFLTYKIKNDKKILSKLPTLIPTGIKSYFNNDEVLELFVRSSLALKKGLVLANSTGIIDSDYYNNIDNEGHIQFMFYNFSFFDIKIKKGDRIGQGIFKKFLLSDNDTTDTIRTGGFGNTTIN